MLHKHSSLHFILPYFLRTELAFLCLGPPTALVTLQSCAFLLTPCCSLISLCHSELFQQASHLHFTTGSNYHKKHPKHLSQLLYDFLEGYSYYTTSKNTQRQFPHRNLNSTTKTKLRKEKAKHSLKVLTTNQKRKAFCLPV